MVFPVCFVYPWPFRLQPTATSADLPLGFLTCSRPANVYYNYESVDSIQLPQLSIVPCCSVGHRLGSFGLFFLTSLVTSQSRLLTTKATSSITDRVFSIFSDSIWMGDTEKHPTKISSRPRVESRTFRLLALRVTARPTPLRAIIHNSDTNLATP